MKKADLGLWVVIVLLLVAIGSTVAYKHLLSPVERPVVVAELESDCDLHSTACKVDFPQRGSVSLSITPQPIPVVQPLKIVVETAISGVEDMHVDFSGVDMNMGQNIFRLTRVAPGRYEGEAMLPVCVRSRMKWEAKLYLTREQEMLAAPFRFDTVSGR